MRQWRQTSEAAAAMVMQWWQTSAAAVAMVRQWRQTSEAACSGHGKAVAAD